MSLPWAANEFPNKLSAHGPGATPAMTQLRVVCLPPTVSPKLRCARPWEKSHSTIHQNRITTLVEAKPLEDQWTGCKCGSVKKTTKSIWWTYARAKPAKLSCRDVNWMTIVAISTTLNKLCKSLAKSLQRHDACSFPSHTFHGFPSVDTWMHVFSSPRHYREGECIAEYGYGVPFTVNQVDECSSSIPVIFRQLSLNAATN